MADRRLKTSDYTVGLICALRIELAAVELLLDETHQDFPQGLNDADFYSFGRIGEHNVVIACLHDGNLGITSAATAASQMVSEFPSIRFAMLVGIGGGVPREDTDIRLGDVVISLPQMQHGGLVQYDLEKTAGEGRLMRTGSLNIPPPIHLYALSKFRSKGIRGLVNLSTHLSALAHLPEFVYQGADSDTLYKATYSHAGGSTCEGCSRDELVLRDPRKISGVSLHFGTIASGNQVLKDGVTRDRLSKELGDVLCVEMEAAGLIDNFPCLVIRGICDYADSHKNTRWQAYAAATAAACAKELLGTVPASELLSASSLYEDSFTPVPSLIDDSGSSLGGVSHVAQKEFAALFKHELIKAVTLRPTLKQPTLKYSLLVELLRGYASIKSLSASPGMQEIAVRLVGRQAARISTLFLEDIQPGAYPAPNISFDHLRKYLAPSSMDKVRVWNPDDAAPPDLDTDQSTETMEDKAELEELPVEFEPVRTFLISGDPFVSLVTNIQKHLLDEGSDILWDIRTTVVATLEARRLRFGSKIAARFHVAWDLVDYMRTQFRDGQDIHKILTLSGSSDYAQALSCEEYISYHWPSIGQALLGAVQSILLRGGNIEKYLPDFEISILDESPSTTIVAIVGHQESIVEFAQALSWLTAALRTSNLQQVALSQVKFRYAEKFSDAYCYFSITTEPLQISTQTEASCWHPLFINGVIAHGFPITQREEECGLEATLSILATLSGANHPVEYDGGIILQGFRSLLVPTNITEKSVQWHFISKPDHSLISARNINDYFEDWAKKDDMSILSLRAFLGLWKIAEVHLGTKSFDVTNVEYTQTRGTGRKAEITSGSLGFAAGSAISGIGGPSLVANIAIGSNQTNQYMDLGPSFDEALRAAMGIPMILYDAEERVGWLVSRLSVMLCLAHIRIAKLKLTDQYPVRYADARWDGGQAALDAIQLEVTKSRTDPPQAIVVGLTSALEAAFLRERDNEIQEIERAKAFCELIKKIYIATDKIEEGKTKIKHAGLSIQSPYCLEGWELMDIATIRPPYRIKKQTLNTSSDGWIRLTQTCAVLICKGIGQVIRPAPPIRPEDQVPCKKWSRIPSKRDYLTATMDSLELLYTKCGSDLQTAKLDLDGLFWHRSEMVHGDCKDPENERCPCERLQRLLKRKDKAPCGHDPRGAVVFGLVHPVEEVLARITSAVQ